MKVGIGMSFFDSEKEIPRALNPIYKHVDKIYAIDGRYSNYVADHDYSIDNSVKLLEKYPNVVIDKLVAFQPDKRQRYLDLAGEDKCDYLIVFDSDDFIHPDYQNWDLFYKNLEKTAKKNKEYQLFYMKTFIPNTWAKAHNAIRWNTWKKYTRIHKNPGQQRYCLDCHYWWCNKDTTDEDLVLGRKGMYITKHLIDGVRLTTDSTLRTDKKLEARDNWAWNNICEEQRRLYFKNCDYLYGYPHPEEDGFWSYNEKGKPIEKIAEEDGTLVPKILNNKVTV